MSEVENNKLRALRLVGDIIITVMIFVFFMAGIFLWYYAVTDGNQTNVKIETDRIAACAASADVVGCLEALK